MKLESDDFELFDLPRRHALDRAALDARWRAAQAKVHPDRFAAAGGAAQRIATQWAVRVNEAYQRLKDPVRRGVYLCQLNGVTLNAETNTAMPAAFLVQQMEWREALEQARSVQDVERIERQVRDEREVALAQLTITLDERRDYLSAADQIRALMFLERFAQDIDWRLESLGQ